ncbi:MAG: hypothetical protein JST00_16670 [Deltaproteobacteria bacterium]|nr:hypothetical protein [Deltaproteobacteria bacterium]
MGAPGEERQTIGQEVVSRAASGEPDAVRDVVTRLAPVVRLAVARVLFRYRSRARNRDIAQETEDLAQESFAALFEDEGRALRSWDPARGASLETFARIVAERTALAILRSGRRSPFTEDPTIDADLEVVVGLDSRTEERVASRDLLVRINDRLKEKLTPRGYLLFQRLYVEDADIDTVCAELAMEKDAIYAWRHRFGQVVEKAFGDLEKARARERVFA